jgi:molybdate transport system substrate-binding protein
VRAGAALAAALSVVAVAACGSGRPADAGGSGTVTVFAAASLTEAFTRLARDVEAESPGTTVTLVFGASSTLARQVVDGAPADVLATASPATMTTAVDAGAAEQPRTFARNRLQIAVPAGAPDVGLADFADRERTLALCAPQVPCGAAAGAVFAAAGVSPQPDTLERDVKAALAKVRLGEVDAALVYRTDVLAAGDDVRGIDVPEAAVAVNDYPVARLTQSRNPTGAALFVDALLSQEGQRVLADAGFDRP